MKECKKIAVVGANGKMGSLICQKLESEFEIIKVDLGSSLDGFNDLDLVIDFASGKSSGQSAVYCQKHKVRLLVGSTGQSKEDNEAIYNLSKSVPVLKSGNFSIGIYFIKKMISFLCKNIEKCKDFNKNTQNLQDNDFADITIFEKHHKQKADKPSGTAVELSNLVYNLTGNYPTVLAERGGKEIGTHSIDFYFGSELISLKHQAFSREVFADGAVMAVRFLLRQTENRLYSFEDVLNEL